MGGSPAWLLGLLLTAAAVTLVLNLLQAKRINTGLVESVADSQEQLRAALDSSQDCARQLERRNAETKNKVTLHGFTRVASWKSHLYTLRQARLLCM